MTDPDEEEPAEYASPACFLHELSPEFAGLTPAAPPPGAPPGAGASPPEAGLPEEKGQAPAIPAHAPLPRAEEKG
ncbi:hypothetical protein SAMN02745194_03301 [Roseomonas rosea]|uniref:Uncharacterized protein n=1 Tax=Muricoccus roseus TaxID=198092 RepID=A0A1M6LX46_9PROT|nr:hypothetical protein [Roseomonas rosea]SHJ75673.1 hypothetical protein SAMN02745194_03301 [Roseomonas rosea]